MATRRIVATDRTIFEKDDAPVDPTPELAPTLSRGVMVKLAGFTAAMILVPLGSFFLTLNTVFQGNTTYAGGLAALMANSVLIAYILVAMGEDTGGSPGPGGRSTGVETKKEN